MTNMEKLKQFDKSLPPKDKVYKVTKANSKKRHTFQLTKVGDDLQVLLDRVDGVKEVVDGAPHHHPLQHLFQLEVLVPVFLVVLELLVQSVIFDIFVKQKT